MVGIFTSDRQAAWAQGRQTDRQTETMDTFADLGQLKHLGQLLELADAVPTEYLGREGSRGWLEATEEEQAHLFRQEFRMSRDTFVELVRLVEGVAARSRSRRPLKHPVSSRVGMTVRYLAGASYWDLARIYDTAPNYVHQLVNNASFPT